MRVAGADVWKKKWVVVVLDDGCFSHAFVESGIADAVARLTDCVAIGIDMPIGLPAPGESRPADPEARRFVGRRSSSVFSTPSRAILDCTSAAEANLLARECGWPGITSQAFALKDQILAVAELAEVNQRIWEVHPEVSFAEASKAVGGCTLRWSKSGWNGTAERRLLLERHGIVLPEDLGDAGVAGVADVLDAAIAAWSADRIARGTAESIPANAERIGAIWR